LYRVVEDEDHGAGMIDGVGPARLPGRHTWRGEHAAWGRA